MSIAGIAPSTSKAYLRAVRDLSLHTGRPPADLEIEDIIDHLAHYKTTRKIGSSSMNLRVCGIRYYYREVLNRLDPDLRCGTGYGLLYSQPSQASQAPQRGDEQARSAKHFASLWQQPKTSGHFHVALFSWAATDRSVSSKVIGYRFRGHADPHFTK